MVGTQIDQHGFRIQLFCQGTRGTMGQSQHHQIMASQDLRIRGLNL